MDAASIDDRDDGPVVTWLSALREAEPMPAALGTAVVPRTWIPIRQEGLSCRSGSAGAAWAVPVLEDIHAQRIPLRPSYPLAEQ